MSFQGSRIQLLGYFGWGNFGDDLFREVCQERAGMLWPQGRVRVFEGQRQNFSHPRPDAALRRLWASARGSLWATSFAHCGGSVFTELRGTAALRLKLPGLAFEALGISVGPFDAPADQDAVVAALKGFSRVVVRDQESFDRLRGDGVLGGDLAALSRRVRASEVRTAPVEVSQASPPGRDTAERERSAGVVICPSQAAPESAEDAAAQIAAALASTDERICVLALNAHPHLGDHVKASVIADELHKSGRNVELLEYGSLGIDGVFDVLGRAQLVWSQRLHGAIVSYLLGTPVAIVDHHEKCGAFARDIGLDSRFLAREFSELAATVDSLVPARSSGAGTGTVPWTRPVADYVARAEAAYRPSTP